MVRRIMAGQVRMIMVVIMVMIMSMRGVFHRNQRHRIMPGMARHGRKHKRPGDQSQGEKPENLNEKRHSGAGIPNDS